MSSEGVLDLGSYGGVKRAREMSMFGSAAAGGGGMEASAADSSAIPIGSSAVSYPITYTGGQPTRGRRLIGPLLPDGKFFKRGVRRGYNKYGYKRRSYRRRRYSKRYGRRSFGSRGYHNTNIVVGRGGYWGRMLGERFGNADMGDRIGDLIGAGVRTAVPYGGALMGAVNALGDAHKMWRGRGDYETVGNDIIHGGGVGHSVVPQFAPSKDGNAVVVSHKEYIGDIFGPSSGAFNVQTFALNPGLESTFPWLSQVAMNYQEYEMVQCIFTYRSTVTDFAATSGQQGIVLSATQYNPSEPAFSDKASMMEYDGAMSCKVTQNLLSGVECDPAKNALGGSKYIRAGPVTGMQDLKTYDMGNFNIGVLNVPPAYAGQSIGELWVSYTIVLRKPKFFTARGYSNSCDRFISRWRPLSVVGANGSLTNPFGAVLQGAANNIGCELINSDGVAGGAPGGADVSPTTQIVFPPNFSGNVKVSVTVLYHSASGSGNGAAISAGVVGNIKPIGDRPGATAGNYGDYEQITTMTSATPPGYPISQWVVSGETVNGGRADYYWAITPSSGGVANVATFAFGGLANSGSAVVALASVEITEINTIGDSSPTGPNYVPRWVDAFGTPQADVPTFWS